MFGRFKIIFFFHVNMIASAAADVLVTSAPELEKLERRKLHKIQFYDYLEALILEANLQDLKNQVDIGG